MKFIILSLSCILIIFVILVILVILILQLLKNYYYNVIHKYFRCDKNNIVYDYYLKNFIQVVSKKNYFMNYGLWEENETTLHKSNKKLCNFIYEKGQLNNYDKFNILDVGCGYGAQDVMWCKNLSVLSQITAIDISKKQIKYANKKLKKQPKIKNRIKYIHGDAHNLLDIFENNSFNRIISLESAFHYNNRQQFFTNVNNLLTDDGIFIISDIVLQNNNKDCGNSIFKNVFIKIASDFLCIPEQNLITLDKWKTNIENSGLCITELYNITDKTFNSYYNYFFKNYIKKKNLPTIFYSILYNMFKMIQPFDYIVAVCKKNLKN